MVLDRLVVGTSNESPAVGILQLQLHARYVVAFVVPNLNTPITARWGIGRVLKHCFESTSRLSPHSLKPSLYLRILHVE
jgi:hypothetical protein